MLRAIDIAWIEHLELMDYARGSVGLRSYGQKEPIIEYRRESSTLFKDFWERVNTIVVNNIDKMVLEKKKV